MAIINIKNAEDFKEKTKEGTIAIVDCWAPWCAPCKMFGPTFEKTSEDSQLQNVSFLKVNVDEEALQQVAIQFGVRSIPTILLLKNGKVVDQKLGVISSDALKEMIKSHL